MCSNLLQQPWETSTNAAVQLTNGRARIQIWQADPRRRRCLPGNAARPRGLSARHGSPTMEPNCVTLRKLLSLSLLICKMRVWDKINAVPSGATTVMRKTNGVLSNTVRCEKEKSLSKLPVDYNSCGFLAPHNTFPSFWTQHTDFPWGEPVLSNSVPMCLDEADLSPLRQVTKSANTPRPQCLLQG